MILREFDEESLYEEHEYVMYDADTGHILYRYGGDDGGAKNPYRWLEEDEMDAYYCYYVMIEHFYVCYLLYTTNTMPFSEIHAYYNSISDGGGLYSEFDLRNDYVDMMIAFAGRDVWAVRVDDRGSELDFVDTFRLSSS